ncbi:hypothetical protein [Bacillus andreraoultii]|uniref:hypothetical protein n=1 Tax=Bacillus andreraoultii TaxID=1499685 RepID=UPI001112085B|nr:hypothetical protein [Bacillus andreraoultii]
MGEKKVLFESEELKNRFEDLKDFCKQYEIDCYHDGISILEEEEDEEEYSTLRLNTNSEIIVYLPNEAEDLLELSDLIQFVEEARQGYFLNDYTFISGQKAYIRIGTSHINFQDSMISEMNFQSKIDFEDISYNVDIVWGLNSFNFKLAEKGLFSKYVPPYLEEDIFIVIESDKKIVEAHLDIIFDSYFFELKSTFNLEIEPNPWIYELWDYDEDEDDFKNMKEISLRPLLQGRGIKELLSIYKSAFDTSYPQQQILSFSRVIEYVSQTVIRKDLIEKTMIKLSSNRALSPDSNFILELGKIFEEHRDLGKDYQAFKITISTCCDIYELAQHAPEFLKKTNKITLNSNKDQREQAFKEIVDAVTATRNMFAHAKTNYKPKGSECPTEQLEEFSGLMDIIAQQTIRWFSVQKEDNRIV